MKRPRLLLFDWPPVLTLETAERQALQALQALDLAFAGQASPEEVSEKLNATSLADERLVTARKEEQPGWN
jgi:hypothetical protein